MQASINNNKNNFKGTHSFELVDQAMMTENPERKEIATNTIDMFEAELRCHNSANRQNNNILDEEYLVLQDNQFTDDIPEILIQDENEIREAEEEKKREAIRSSNLFMSLN